MTNTKQRDHVLEGRVWVLRDPDGRIIDNIDTDMIFHNAHLAVTELELMGRYALGNLVGYEDFSGRAEPGDIIVAGSNFGRGSSRQQAVDCFLALGIQMVLAESFGAIYKRNAINAGFPIMEAGGLSEARRPDDSPWLLSGDRIRVDLRTGELFHLDTEAVHVARPLSPVQLDIYQAGGLFGYRPPEL